MERSTDYSNLKAGDLISVDGFDELVEIHFVAHKPGGGAGMGEYPDTWTFVTDHGVFTYDPWASHTYQPYQIVKLAVVVKPKQFDAVYKKKGRK